MSHSCVIKKSELLTDVAKRIFGDVVRTAYYYESYYTHLKMSVIVERLDKQESSAQHTHDSVDQDGKTIVLEFTNGNMVVFSNSEWGAMEKLEPKEFIIV